MSAFPDELKKLALRSEALSASGPKLQELRRVDGQPVQVHLDAESGAENIVALEIDASRSEQAMGGATRWHLDEQRGVYPVATDVTGERASKICGPLRVVAQVRNTEGMGWEYMVEVRNDDNAWVTLRIPRSVLLGSEPKAAFNMLADAGLWMPNAKSIEEIRAYIRDTASKARRARSVPSAGWQANGRVYLAADRRQWPAHGELYLLDNERLGDHGLSANGSLEHWRTEVAARCVGNSRLVFAVSAAFAGPVLRDAGAPGGGYHLVGSSSEGKTTALEVAASVWGFPGTEGGSGRPFVQSWNSTANALSAIAARHSDGLLVVDEIGQADPRTIGGTVYTLANGRERERMNQAGKVAGGGATWRIVFLSSGEKDLAVAIEEGGHTAKAGQDARLPSIPANAGRGMGLFENLHDSADGKSFAGALSRATRAQYGTAIGAWLQHLSTRDPAKRASAIQAKVDAFEQRATKELGPSVAGEVHRVVSRFAVVAAAGELATDAGITGWPAGEATRGAWLCFQAWLARRGGTGSKDCSTLLNHVRGLLERHQSTRFELREGGGIPGAAQSTGARDRLGFTDSDQKLVYIQPETFRREFAKGTESPATAAAWLAEAGFLLERTNDPKTPSSHPWQRHERIKALGLDKQHPTKGRLSWVYVLDVAAISAGSDEWVTATPERVTAGERSPSDV